MRTRLTGRRFGDTLSRSGSSKQARQTEMDPAFIEEFQAAQEREPFFREPLLKLAPETSDARCVSLAVMERLFFAVGASAVTPDTSYWDSPRPGQGSPREHTIPGG